MATAMARLETGATNSGRLREGRYFNLPIQSSEILTEIPKEWIDRLFARLWAWYGKMIEERWGDDTALAKAIWREDLVGLSLAQLKAGIDACRNHCKFPPTLPEFRALCLESHGVVDAKARWESCRKHNYSCDAEYWAVQWYGYYEFDRHDWDQARRRWCDLLMDAFDDQAAGKLSPIPDHVKNRVAL